VHGANRLASNSLLEGLVFADRIGRDLARAFGPDGEPAPGEPTRDDRPQLLLDPSARSATQQAMSAGAGVLRNADSLARTTAELQALLSHTDDDPRAEAWEATNLQQIASVLAEAAGRREETRGSHWREDFPATDDVHWRARQVAQATADGVRVSRRPVPGTEGSRQVALSQSSGGAVNPANTVKEDER
jgi:aspartate oxidase